MLDRNAESLGVKRGCGIGSLSALFLFSIIFGLVTYLTRPVILCAEAFLAEVSEHHLTQAYASTSKDFRDSTSQLQLEEFCRLYGLDQYQAGSAQWGNRRIRDQDGYVSGSFTTKTGKSVSLIFRLRYEEGAWRISKLKPSSKGG